MKYVVKDHLELYLFGRNIAHADFARQLGGTCSSAGFVNLVTMECYGESEGLGIGSSPMDTTLLRALSRSLPIVGELKVIQAEIREALNELPQTPLLLEVAQRRLTGLICDSETRKAA